VKAKAAKVKAERDGKVNNFKNVEGESEIIKMDVT
jgi:hypothetical protein